MLRYKFMKRILPIALSAAMILGEVPVNSLTVQAANSQVSEIQTVDGQKAEALSIAAQPAEVYTADGRQVEAQAAGRQEVEENTAGSVARLLAGSTDAEDSLPRAVLKVDRTSLGEKVVSYNYAYDYTTQAVLVPYNKTIDHAANLEETFAAVLTASVNDTERSDLKGKIQYHWQRMNESGTYENLGTEEKAEEVGSYRLLATLDAVDGVCRAADAVFVKVEIQKAVLEIQNYVKNIEPGTTVAAVKLANQNIRFAWNKTKVDTAAYVKSFQVVVREAYTGAELADSVALQKNQDYTLNFEVTLADAMKDSFEVDVEPVRIVLGNALPTEIEITYAHPGTEIGKEYDKTSLDFNTVVKPELSAIRVLYTQDGEKKTLVGAEPVGAWCDANKEELAAGEAPLEAGTYFYKLTYEDPNGTYAPCELYVRVVIRAITVAVAPKLNPPQVYEGTTVWDIIRAASYEVYALDSEGVSTGAVKLDEYFWGVVYNQENASTQSYEPVFRVQSGVKDEEEKIIWTDMGTDDEITYSPSVYYRLVFAGDKAVYTPHGYRYYTSDINNAQKNYTVDTSYVIMDKYATELTVLAAKAVSIRTDRLLQDGAGTGFHDPITKVYDGTDWYQNKGEYKKATVRGTGDGADVASDADDSLTYTWEKLSDNYALLLDDDRNVIVPSAPTESSTDTERILYNQWVNAWTEATDFYTYDGVYEDYEFHNVETHCSPYQSGIYRLKISYHDVKHVYRDATTYVYYVIMPQDAMAVLTGSPIVYADGINTVEDLLTSLQNTDKDAANTYLDVALYPVTVVESASGAVTRVKGDSPLALSTYSFYKYPTTYLCVEKKVTAEDGTETWKKCKNTDILDADSTYRININNFKAVNYNFNNKLGLHNQVVKTGYYDNETAAVRLRTTKGIGVKIQLDESKITGNVKTYDGLGFDITNLVSLVRVVTIADGTDVTGAVDISYTFVDQTDGYSRPGEYSSHGGNYAVVISTATNDTYKGAQKTLDTLYTVNPRKVSLTPQLYKSIPTEYVGSSYNVNKYVVESWQAAGVMAGDEGAVTGVYFRVYEANSGEPYDGCLKSGETYYVKIENYTYSTVLDEYTGTYISFARDYAAEEIQKSFVPDRVAASVPSDGGNALLYDTVTVDGLGDFSHTITPREGIPNEYVSSYIAEGMSNNVFRFRIYAPKEMTNAYDFSFTSATDYVYANSIRNAGGLVAKVSDSYIDVAFDAATKRNYTFDILWKNGYVEHFIVNLAKCILEDDLTQAVAPKTLKFNGVNNKMVVGDTQQLDVRVTKNQLLDVIYLGYSVDDNAVLKVEENGFITALSKGTASVTVYPCKRVRNAEGVYEKVAIEGAKSAKVRINVSDVMAPKLAGVTAGDTYASVRYVKPSNGYRRELYVLEGKKTAADFEALLKEVKNGDYSAFCYTNFVALETTDEKGVVTRTVSGLLPDGQYTAYVRNVSGLRLLDDGSTVAVSAAGSTRAIKTTKSQEIGLKASVTKKVEYTYGYDELAGSEGYYYEAQFANKLAKITVDAKFLLSTVKSYSDEEDYVWRTLPLSKEQAASMKQSYTMPKLTYYVSRYRTSSRPAASMLDNYVYVDGYWYYKNADIQGRTDDLDTVPAALKGSYVPCADGYWYYKTPAIASVDKVGRITFKGSGWLYAIAVDTNSGNGAVADLFINAAPDSMAGKQIKLEPGQTYRLADTLTYRQGKTVLAGYQMDYADLSVTQSSNDYFDIAEDGQGGYLITALKSGGSLNLNVTDKAVASNRGTSITVRVMSSEIEPVKNLRVNAVSDMNAEITFTYPLASYEFRFDLRDAKGLVISNEVATLKGTWSGRPGRYIYTYGFEPLTLLSEYSVLVTAQSGAESSAESRLKFKTTNIPASYAKIDAAAGEFGGTNVTVRTNGETHSLNDNLVLKSGNTYTLDVPLDNLLAMDNQSARVRMTDTLRWKSTSPGVASLKVNTGSYSAQLKATKPGTTIIQVTSKQNKQVIARYAVTINAVGDGNGYFEFNEPYERSYITDYDYTSVDVEGRDALAVTLDNEIGTTITKGQGQWFVFTAPAYGDYTISAGGGTVCTLDNGKLVSGTFSGVLEKNAKKYVYVTNTTNDTKYVYASVTGTLYEIVSLGDNNVRNGRTIIFTAPEDNYYTFTYTADDGTEVTEYRSLAKDEACTLTVDGGTSGKDYVLTVTRRELADEISETGLTQITVGRNEEKWYSFKASETNLYAFSFTTGETSQLHVAMYMTLMDPSYTKRDIAREAAGITEVQMLKDQTIYFMVSSSTATKRVSTIANVRVTKRVPTNLTVDTEKTIQIAERGEVWFEFTAPETNLYTFRGIELSEYTQIRYYTSLNSLEYRTPADGAGSFNSTEFAFEKDDKIYICIYSTAGTTQEPVTGRFMLTKRTVLGELSPAKIDVEIDSVGEVWYSFTAPEDNYYTFRATGITSNIGVYYYAGLNNTRYTFSATVTTGDNKFVSERYLTAGTMIYVKLTAITGTDLEPVKASVWMTRR